MNVISPYHVVPDVSAVIVPRALCGLAYILTVLVEALAVHVLHERATLPLVSITPIFLLHQLEIPLEVIPQPVRPAR